ncbi:ACT domain-containing protein [Nocardioides marmoriginsengisoli]|uniref:ACT domain-containing protein n=1 Tax=Nocardioides marmoriginsengisoli TaxID=661483 RepID=A0A3N0CKW0_9ACTN|nr:ACT domain-containing protein [Nocardioides marmoriginsengisoli]RNL64080.1 ACT domain-containing protein [Nocardioides marmoriginsengisoli]
MSETPQTFTLHQYPEKLIVASLPVGAEIPEWAESASLFAVIATATETTLVCAGRSAPKKVQKEGPFTAFAVAQTLEFTMTGVLHGLLAPLAEAEISVFTVSTYPTDWILVPTEQAEEAAEAWRRRGHTVTLAPVVK